MPRPRGRSKTARLTVNLEPQEYAALQSFAHREDVAVAWLIRRAVTEFLASHPEAQVQAELPLERRPSLTPRIAR